MEDIRDKPIIRHEDVVALNFIKDTGRYVFRRHHLNGLRSHIMEVLSSEDVLRESRGVWMDGVRRFPVARPVKMLRIFRRRFSGVEEVFDEIRRFQIVGNYLTAAHLAMSEEFVVDYLPDQKHDILLCGLQEYVPGEHLDPWLSGNVNILENIARKLTDKAETRKAPDKNKLIRKIEISVGSFVDTVKKMVREVKYIPDLAGNRNILVTPDGSVKLVDINNISRVAAEGCIPVDDHDYPVCDKSIEALLLIEQKLLQRNIRKNDPFYSAYLHPERLQQVKALERKFQLTGLKLSGTKNI